MSGSGRKRLSKWDLRDDPEFAPDCKSLRSGWSSADVAASDGSKWSYLEGTDKQNPNLGFSSKEPFSGRRGSNKGDITNKDYSRGLDAPMAWDADEAYSTRMSPGFEEWKHKRHIQSPKNGWGRSIRSRSRSKSRSRSRSPARNLRWDADGIDRNRMRAGGSTQPCRDFAAGKCRRGTHCHFLHHDNQNYRDCWESRHRKDGAARYSSSPDESREYSLRNGRPNEACINFAKGRCRMGASCKYVHHGNSDGFDKGSVDESTGEREIDRRRRESSFEHGGGHEPNRSSDTPCKFFAAGKCRNGKYCRFSHDRQARRSPNSRLRDERWGRNPSGDRVLDRPKWSDSVNPNGRPRDDRQGSDRNMLDADKVWDGPKWNDMIGASDIAKLGEDKSENIGPTESGFTAWTMSDGWDHSLDKHKLHGESPVASDKKETNQWKAENAGANMGVSQSIGTDIWLGDAEMSPDWNYRVGSSGHIKEEHGQNKHSLTQDAAYLPTSEHDRIQVAPGNHMLDVPVSIHPVSIEKTYSKQNQNFDKDGAIAFVSDDESKIKESAGSHTDMKFSTVLPGQGFNLNAQSANALHPSSCHAVDHNQVAVPIVPPRGGNVEDMLIQEVSNVKKYNVERNIMDVSSSQVASRNPPTQNMVINAQLAQLTNLSASLAHLLGTGQQLPQLYAALNAHDAKDTPSVAKVEGSGEPVSTTFIKPDPAVGFQKLYDPMCDSIEPKQADTSENPPALTSSKKIAEDEIENPSLLSNLGKQNCGDSCKTASSEEHRIVNSEQLIQLQPNQNIEVMKEKNEVVAEERQNSRDDDINTQENGPLEHMDRNGGPDEAKKIKDVKGIRAFKFALVEFVKELLKPTWKEGHITKEDYKTIVKKVVDKVTGTMQGTHIPQTQEKIDHYLSFSKPKLNKLVQAYVEKVQKA